MCFLIRVVIINVLYLSLVGDSSRVKWGLEVRICFGWGLIRVED